MRNKRNMMNNQRRHQNNRYGRSGGGQRNYSGGMEGEGDSDFISPRQRKMAMTQREKYMNMGRDAAQSGDRVQAEYYFQHADHYLRIINLSNPPQQQNQHQNQQHQNQDDASDPAGMADDAGDDEAGSLSLDQVLPLPKSAGSRHDDADDDSLNA